MGVHPHFRFTASDGSLRACPDKTLRKGITRFEFKGRADIVSAVRLYEKTGIVHEATLRKTLRFDGTYYDALQMSLFRGVT